MFESNVSIFSQFNSRRAKKMKRMQRDGIISTSFHSLWICVVVLLHIVNETMVEAVCAPLNKGDLNGVESRIFTDGKESVDRRRLGEQPVMYFGRTSGLCTDIYNGSYIGTAEDCGEGADGHQSRECSAWV
jgi:hypothetical protein